MIKVIKKGSEKEYMADCPFCYSTLSFTKNDVLMKNEEVRGLLRKSEFHLFKPTKEYIEIATYKRAFIDCPNCGRRVDVSGYILSASELWDKVSSRMVEI